MRFIYLVLLTVLSMPGVAKAELPVLTVYTYDSFTSEWGPGPAVEKNFEAVCGCDLQFVAAEDGAALLSRLKLEGAESAADIVLGLDNSLMAEAAAEGLFAAHGQDSTQLDLPIVWTDTIFLPFDYGYFAFIYDRNKLAQPPASLRALVDSDIRILIQDPRTSTPGLGLLLWIKAVYGEAAGAAWGELRPQIVTVTKGWSEAYGLFLEGEAEMVLSYTTSPAYHRIAESEDRFVAARFEEGHYLQVEVAAKLTTAPQPELADRFMAFMVGPGFQEAIATGNWMYPAVMPDAGLPEGFDPPIEGAATLTLAPDQVAAARKGWIEEWLSAFTQ